MRSVLAGGLLFALTAITSLPTIEAYAGEVAAPLPPAVPGEDIDIKLPITTPLVSQWIVIVEGGQMQIVPARTRKEDDGVVISATVSNLKSDSLRAAVATSQDGNIISTALKPGKK